MNQLKISEDTHNDLPRVLLLDYSKALSILSRQMVLH